MPQSHTEFEELHECLAKKSGDFQEIYKIKPTDPLTIYKVLNSPRVNARVDELEFPELEHGKVNTAATRERLSKATDIARDRETQRKYGNFLDVATRALTLAESILTDAQKCRQYASWLNQRGKAEPDRSQAEAKEKRRLQKQKEREELDRKLRLAEERARKAEREKEELERKAAAQRVPEKSDTGKSSGWGDLFAKILEKAVSQSAAPGRPAHAPELPAININGFWNSMDGMGYRFYQSGSALRLVVTNPLGLTVTEGEGSIVAGKITVVYYTMTPAGPTQGRAEAQLSPDGRTIQGWYHNFNLGTQGPVHLFR
jgi:hypothetical protein